MQAISGCEKLFIIFAKGSNQINGKKTKLQIQFMVQKQKKAANAAFSLPIKNS